ncbi:MAG: hypothetical protein IJZ79_03450 [Bacilli bacterium]|nr:hypothetical protein [Bacilli bacterium]MBQ8218784.1 hypothetical protein [Bacilli bacterium]
MNNAILLTKLNNYDDMSFELYKYYVDATSKSFADNAIEFSTCIEDIKKLTNYQYDFGWLSENASKFGVNRRDFKSLCDDVCVLLGNRIQELCSHTREYIITKPSKYEDYCPFSSEALVAYGNPANINRSNIVKCDGQQYSIIDCKLEESPYYIVYCSTFNY